MGEPVVIIQPGLPEPYRGVLQVRSVSDLGVVSQSLYVDPELDDEARARLFQWAVERLDRLAEHGPEPDGWGEHAVEDGVVFQLLAREVWLGGDLSRD